MWKFKIVALLLCGSAMAQVQDQTRVPGAAGPQVVESVVNLIHESCTFPNDRMLLRRVAYFATNDGQDSDTYRPGFDGGIWAVSQQDFNVTQNDPRLMMYYSDINSRFGIDWNRLTWSELKKPLMSGLAAALFLVQSFGDNVPVGVENQATWYQKLAYPNNPGMAYNFTKLAQQLDTACGSSNLDLAFLVDSSSSLSPSDFNQAVKFAADVLDPFEVSPTAVRVALLTFSTGFHTEFVFDTHSSKAAVQTAIKAAQYRPGQTDTDQALGYAGTTLFTAASGARIASAKVAVVITDGHADHSVDAIQKAEELKNKGVTVFVIGVGDQIDKNELNSLATQPNCTHVQTLKGYQDLDSLRAEIQQLSCRAPVVLQEGTYSFPCGNTNNFRIAIQDNETITISTSSGFVDVYGSFLNPYPNSAFNEFKARSMSNQDAIIYVRNETRPLYLSIVSQNTDPAICPAGGTFNITVQNRNAIRTNAKVICYENGILRECTPLDYLMAIYYVTQPSNLGFPSPCHPPTPGYFIHPTDVHKFIYCNARGVAYVVYCPNNYYYNDAQRSCLFGNPPTQAPATTHMPVITQPPQQVTSGPVGANPCTLEALNQGNRFFPYLPDPHKYIACTEWPNYAVVKDCAPYHRWSQVDLACIYDNTVVNPTHNVFVTSPAPLDVDCKPGLTDGSVFYHAYPGDATKFIQCDQYGDAFIKDCPPGKLWSQHFLVCMFGPTGTMVG